MNSQIALQFTEFNKEDSNSTLVLLKYPYQDAELAARQIGHNKHTDIGSITVLFTEEWGPQVPSATDTVNPDQKEHWKFIEPRRDCAVINVGDSLRFRSEKKLRSCLQRVVPKEGQEVDRYTIAYLLLPSNNVLFVDRNRMATTNWHGKYEVFKDRHEDQRKDTVLTGGSGGDCGLIFLSRDS